MQVPDFDAAELPIHDLQKFYQASKVPARHHTLDSPCNQARFDSDEGFKKRAKDTVVELQSGTNAKVHLSLEITKHRTFAGHQGVAAHLRHLAQG